MFSTRSAFVVLAALTQAVVAQTQTHGQVVGDPTATSAVVWTRCSQVALVSVQYSVVPTLAGALETAQVPALANRDFTVRHADGRVEKRVLTSADELLLVLQNYFGLSFPLGTRFALRPDVPWPT